jgi:4-alpha-glucanotransferase
VLEREGYQWLVDRLRHTLSRFDAVRLDHFIAFHRYWEIPAGASTARDGRFVEAPGHDFFSTLHSELGSLPFVAEDLGLVTDEVRRLRERFDLPGMSVLQFGFANGAEFYLPHRAEKAMVVYTGTHDNNTIIGWLNEPEQQEDDGARYERQRAREYAGSDGSSFNWDMIRLALMSVVDTAIFPMQDVLGLDASARMNVPGTPSGNWRWRLSEEELSQAEAERLCHLCRLYQRTPDTAPKVDGRTSP